MAEAYARSFAGLCAGAVPTMLAGLPPGSRLVDVGCGTGTLALAAGRAGHRVVAVEPDAEMAALASDVLASEVVVAGLPDLPLADDSFDTVLASFVLNHVDDPRTCAREVARVAAPGGVVRATIWGSAPQPQALMWGGLLDEVGAVRPPAARLPVDLDFERSPAGLAGILGEAGLTVARAGTESWRWRVGAEDLWAGLTAVGGFGPTWRAQTPHVRDRLREAYDRLGAPWRDPADPDGGFAFDVTCVFVEARVPTP